MKDIAILPASFLWATGTIMLAVGLWRAGSLDRSKFRWDLDMTRERRRILHRSVVWGGATVLLGTALAFLWK